MAALQHLILILTFNTLDCCLDNLLGGRKIIYDDLFFLNSDQENKHEYLTFAVICDAIACSIENREFVYCYKYSFVNMVVFYKKP